MPFRWDPREHASLALYVLKWLLVAAPVAAAVGSLCALFLWSLDQVTLLRFHHPWLLWLLPGAGLAVGAVYHAFGRSVEGGNNLIVEQIHEPGGGVPARMTPLVLVGTLVTHLFGGSAGREGTAVQMGGGIASAAGRWLRLSPADTRTLLTAGVAAGFGAVFGTPLTGAVFALEVLAVGRMSYEALVPCLIASVVGDVSCTAWHVHHTQYRIAAFAGAGLVAASPRLNLLLLAKVATASVAFGLASVLFAELTHAVQHAAKRFVPWPALRPALGGVAVIALVYVVGSDDYLGLGVTPPPGGRASIVTSFVPGGVTNWSWGWKLLFTAVTVGSGFKGGEVTPLFFVGASLGNVLGRLTGAPVDLMAGLGFVAVFAGATNTPLACTIMGIELFASAGGAPGPGFVVYLATACFLSYLLSGHTGIYLSQRVGTPKLAEAPFPPGSTLRAIRQTSASSRDQTPV